jgi:hypothetical protein
LSAAVDAENMHARLAEILASSSNRSSGCGQRDGERLSALGIKTPLFRFAPDKLLGFFLQFALLAATGLSV